MPRALRGARGSRAERAVESAADPRNLIWVMPAEEGVSEESGRGGVGRRAAGSARRARRPARRARRRGGQRARQRARARARRDRRGRRLRLGSPEARRRSRRRPACGSSAIRRRRTRPTSSSRSTLRRDGARPDPRARRRGRAARPPARGSPAPRLGALRGDADRRARRRRARPRDPRRARSSPAQPGELLTLVAVNGPAVGVTTDGLAYPLRGETLEPRVEPRRVERLRGDTARVDVESGVLLAIRPGRERVIRRAALGAFLAAAAVARAGCGGSDEQPTGRRARHARLVRDLDRRQEGVRGRERPQAQDPQGGRRGRGRQRGAPDRGQPARATCSSASTTTCSPARSTGDLFEPYESPELATRRPGARRSTPSTASTPIDHGDVCLNYDKALVRERGIAAAATLDDLTLPRTGTCSSSRTRRRRRPGSPSCSRRSPSTARTAGRTTGASCAPTACSSSTAGRRRTTTRFTGRRGARATGRSSSRTRRARRPR